MIYKTHKDAYLMVSEKYGIDYDTVKLIGDFYWLDVTTRIENFIDRELYIDKMGVFRFRKAASLRFIERIEKTRLMMTGRKLPEEKIEEAMNKAYEKKARMEPLIKAWDDIRVEYYKHKEKKYAYRNLQEQKANMGGSEKPGI